MCRYAANQASCDAFEKELALFLESQYAVKVRCDLTEANFYSIWAAILKEELQYLEDKFAEADI